MIPNAHVGLDVVCPRCRVRAGERCVSVTGRVLRVTHQVRFRAALSGRDGLRTYVADLQQWRTA